MIVKFDINMNLKQYSVPFKFEDSSIEYCLSLIVEEDKIIIPYSVNDRKCKIGFYSHDEINKMMYNHT